ncbi:MAG TPA: hypothetical protein VK957_03200 [Lunatimonas sp.]|nr:hypothetical protein [Lunatimonas sp.]
MKIFLKLKHWQLFLLTFGILFFLFAYSGIAFRAEEEDRFISDAIVRFITIIPFLAYFLWLWSVGTLLNKHIRKELKTKSSYFYISVVISYFIFFFLLVFNLLEWTEMKEDADNLTLKYILMFIPLFIGIFAWLYALNFVSKTLVRAEREAHVKSADYFGEYVMVLLFPIGIWIIQPRLNRIIEEIENKSVK